MFNHTFTQWSLYQQLAVIVLFLGEVWRTTLGVAIWIVPYQVS